jgi:hypothetical protein
VAAFRVVHILDMKNGIALTNMFLGWDTLTRDIPFAAEAPKRISSIDTKKVVHADTFEPVKKD